MSPTFVRAHSFTAHSPITASDANDSWTTLENFLNTTKLDGANLQASAQPNTSVYRTLLAGSGAYAISTAGPLYPVSISASAYWTSASGLGSDIYYLAAADFASGLTPKLRLRAQLITGVAADAITHTFGLHQITGVSSGTLTVNGTAVAGSTVPFASPSGNTTNQNNSGDFTFPSDGFYIPRITLSGTANLNVLAAFQLQIHHV